MRILGIAALALGALAAGGCSDDTPAVCKAEEQVRASLEEVRDYDLVGEGLDGFQERIDSLVSDLADLREAASDEVADEVEAVSAAATAARSAVDAAGTPQEKLTALRAGATDVQAALEALASALPECS